MGTRLAFHFSTIRYNLFVLVSAVQPLLDANVVSKDQLVNFAAAEDQPRPVITYNKVSMFCRHLMSEAIRPLLESGDMIFDQFAHFVSNNRVDDTIRLCQVLEGTVFPIALDAFKDAFPEVDSPVARFIAFADEHGVQALKEKLIEGSDSFQEIVDATNTSGLGHNV